jgi:hypothetical protein
MARDGTGRRGRRQQADLEEIARVGEQFGLGALEGRTRERSLTIGLGSRSGIADSVSCLFAGGVARVQGRSAQILPWADATMMAFLLEKDQDGQPVPSVSECVIGGPEGLEIRLDDPVAGPAARAAFRALGPRIGAAMVDTYDAGDVVAIGRSFRLDQQSITIPGGEIVAWAEVRQVIVGVLYGGRLQSVPAFVVLTVPAGDGAGLPWRNIGLDFATVPNAAFLGGLMAHAADHHGIPLRGRQW